MIRYYVRCKTCLGVSVVTNEQIPGIRAYKGAPVSATCGVCGGGLESMGRINGEHVETDHTECLCDERCATATGPQCSCKCGGANHGAMMAAYVTVTDSESAPTVTPPGKEELLKARAAEYTEALEAAEKRIEAHPDFSGYTERRSGGYVSSGLFNAYRRTIDRKSQLEEAKMARTHKGRLAKLAEIAKEMA